LYVREEQVSLGSMSRRVLVTGAQGVLGSFIASFLSDAGWEVTRAGRRAESVHDFRLLDLGDAKSVSEACRGADLVVNTAHHPELVLERTILRAGGTLVDLIELPEGERAHLRREIAEPGGLAVVDTGLGGVAYLALAELLREHPDADGAEYALMVSASGSSGPAGALFGHRLLTGARHHRSATIPFAEPFGRRRCLEVGAEGDGVLRRTVRAKAIRHYLCMQPRALNGVLLTLNAARLISLLPRASFTAGAREMPAELSDEPICEWVAVNRAGQRLAARTLGGRGYYRMTAAATVAFAEALVESPGAARSTRGLRSIDELVTLPELQPALEARGIAIQTQSPDGAGGD
jgi:NAD(P)-dependent dehydrogenase (short-subunit alcohol dehydrogenase family)